MLINSLLRFLLFVLIVSTGGCSESSFELSSESRLPKWFSVPDGLSRNQLRVTMDYYADGDVIFKLYAKDHFFKLREVSGRTRDIYPLKLKKTPPGFPQGRPIYEVISVDGVTDIIEHRKKEPIFHVTDNPEIWKELGVELNNKSM